MNPTIKLQENGTVTVTDTETTTTTLSKVTVDEICRLVKEDGEKVKLEVGKWYQSSINESVLYHVTKIGKKYFDAYGFTANGTFDKNERWADIRYELQKHKPYEATPETVQQYLTDEILKRGYGKGVKVDDGNKVSLVKDGSSAYICFFEDTNTLESGDCDGDNMKLFKNGKFATILKPETITRAEAEKRYDVKITD